MEHFVVVGPAGGETLQRARFSQLVGPRGLRLALNRTDRVAVEPGQSRLDPGAVERLVRWCLGSSRDQQVYLLGRAWTDAERLLLKSRRRVRGARAGRSRRRLQPDAVGDRAASSSPVPAAVVEIGVVVNRVAADA